MASSRRLPVSYNEKTFGASGYGRDYTSLATWEDDTDIDLVTAGKGEVLTCYDDASPYNQIITMAGATTNSSYFRVVRAASGMRGTPTSGVRFYSSATATNSYVFNSSEDYSCFYDIECHWSTDTTNQRLTFYFAGNYHKPVGCTAYGRGGTNTIIGFYYLGSNGCVTVNCYSTNGGSGATSFGYHLFTASVNYFYNCTSRYNNIGFSNSLAINQIAKNCISQNNSTAFSSYWTQTTCVTSGVTFEADGYHLSASDTGAKGLGTDLRADATYCFNDDIDGDIRGAIWDIGCDQVSATGKSGNVGQINSMVLEFKYP